MRRNSWIALTAAVALVGCASGGGGGSSGGGTAASPANPPVASEHSTEGVASCAAGNCKITAEFDKQITDVLKGDNAVYKVYEGCPKLNGATTDDTTAAMGVRSAKVLTESRLPVFPIPATMKGHIATVTMWFGAVPKRLVVVDFSTNAVQIVNFGYRAANAASTQFGSSSSLSSKSHGMDTTSLATAATSDASLSDDPGQDNKNRIQLHKICA